MFDKVFLQRSYANLLSNRLNLHKINQSSPYISNFRCDICGDSQINKFKRRAYILEKQGGLFYYCHNCGESSTLENYMRNHHNDLYQQYRLDVLNEINEINEIEGGESHNQSPDSIIDLLDYPYISKSLDDQGAIRYLKYRRIPEDKWDDIYYSKYFKKFIKNIMPGKFSNDDANAIDARIVFPIREDGRVIGCVGRSIENSPMRFYTIKFNNSSTLLYNLDNIDKTKRVYITEGPIDSLFLPNSLALCGSDRNLSQYFYDLSKITIILDNQPRNKEIVRIYQKFIKQGYSIFIWPEHIKEKDINEIIMNDSLKITNIQYIIDRNTFNGISALLRLNKWKKI